MNKQEQNIPRAKQLKVNSLKSTVLKAIIHFLNLRNEQKQKKREKPSIMYHLHICKKSIRRHRFQKTKLSCNSFLNYKPQFRKKGIFSKMLLQFIKSLLYLTVNV